MMPPAAAAAQLASPEVKMADDTEPDYHHLLSSNFERVFSEPDVTKRRTAIKELYVANPVFYEPTAVVVGQEAISEAVSKLFQQFGARFAIVADGSAVGHHGVGCLRWYAGTRGANPVARGIDAAEIVGGKISRLWVLFDPVARG